MTGAVAAVLTDDFTFTSPYDDAIDRATYFERCWPDSPAFRSIVIERICEDEDAAFVLYRCETADGKTFRNTELHLFRGDRLRSRPGLFRRVLSRWRLRRAETIKLTKRT